MELSALSIRGALNLKRFQNSPEDHTPNRGCANIFIHYTLALSGPAGAAMHAVIS